MPLFSGVTRTPISSDSLYLAGSQGTRNWLIHEPCAVLLDGWLLMYPLVIPSSGPGFESEGRLIGVARFNVSQSDVLIFQGLSYRSWVGTPPPPSPPDPSIRPGVRDEVGWTTRHASFFYPAAC
jgi:hypothetical protein